MCVYSTRAHLFVVAVALCGGACLRCTGVQWPPPLPPLDTTAQVFTADEKVDQINDAYWRLRAEVVEEDEAMLAEGDLLLHVVHLNPKLQVWEKKRGRTMFFV